MNGHIRIDWLGRTVRCNLCFVNLALHRKTTLYGIAGAARRFIARHRGCANVA